MQTYKLLNDMLGTEYQTNAEALIGLVKIEYLETIAKQEQYLVKAYDQVEQERLLRREDVKYIATLVRHLARESKIISNTLYLNGMIEAVKECTNLLDYQSIENDYINNLTYYTECIKQTDNEEKREHLSNFKAYLLSTVERNRLKLQESAKNHHIYNYLAYTILTKEGLVHFAGIKDKTIHIEIPVADSTVALTVELDQVYFAVLVFALLQDANLVTSLKLGEKTDARIHTRKQELAGRLKDLNMCEKTDNYKTWLLFRNGVIDTDKLFLTVTKHIGDRNYVELKTLINAHLHYAIEQQDIALYTIITDT